MDPIAFLLSLEVLGMKFGLENMRKLCAALDHPENAFQSVIVAGTNGKGSVTAMTSAKARAIPERFCIGMGGSGVASVGSLKHESGNSFAPPPNDYSA